MGVPSTMGFKAHPCRNASRHNSNTLDTVDGCVGIMSISNCGCKRVIVLFSPYLTWWRNERPGSIILVTAVTSPIRMRLIQ